MSAYVIPDNNVGLVPNVGIVTGSRGTLVIDPGLIQAEFSAAHPGWPRANGLAPAARAAYNEAK